MKAAVVQFPGTTCANEVLDALQLVGSLRAVSLWHTEASLQGISLLVLVGGYTLPPSGAELVDPPHPMLPLITRFAQEGGYVLGISEGFRLLCQLGLLPGSIEPNAQGEFVCRNTYLIPDSKSAPATQYLQRNRPYRIPIAHGHGRYQASPETLAAMRLNGQIMFRYGDAQGRISQAENPDGSDENIAGVCNQAMNVMGMMPHPQRAVSEAQANTDGRLIIGSLVRHIKGNS